jgi:hypothetical protein
MRIKSNVKSGKLATNHNQTARKGLRVRTRVRAGGESWQHNRTVA